MLPVCAPATGSSRSTGSGSASSTTSSTGSRRREGEPVTLQVQRNGKPVEIKVTPTQLLRRELGDRLPAAGAHRAALAGRGGRPRVRPHVGGDEGDRRRVRTPRDRPGPRGDLEPCRDHARLERGRPDGLPRLPPAARVHQPLARAPQPAAPAAARRRPHRLLAGRGDPRTGRSGARSTSGSRSSELPWS